MTRIYKSESKGTSYQGSARSIGFNPQQAADQSKKNQQLKQAIVADGEAISREIQRVQRVENTILQAQQEVDRSTQRQEQAVAKNTLTTAQSLAKGDLANNQPLKAYQIGWILLFNSYLTRSAILRLS